MTFSLAARCAETGMFGVAVASSSPAVGARCMYTRAGVGAALSQNVTDPLLGRRALDLMAKGLSADETVIRIRDTAQFLEYRQVLVIDVAGATAHHSGQKSLGIWTDAAARNVISAGNLLANRDVPGAIVAAFTDSTGHLGDRLIGAMRAGLAAGGEAGPVHSAGMQICDKVTWPVADLRCDWTEDCPIETLSGIWDIYQPQLTAYVQRALDPNRAPSYGVPGDD